MENGQYHPIQLLPLIQSQLKPTQCVVYDNSTYKPNYKWRDSDDPFYIMDRTELPAFFHYKLDLWDTAQKFVCVNDDYFITSEVYADVQARMTTAPKATPIEATD